MDAMTAQASMKKGETGLSGAVKLVVKTFLEESHFQNLHRILADQWRNCHSLTAAVKLMEAHGVRISPEEEQHLAALPEDRMIDALVSRMPAQTREQFEHFFLQLSLIASTTTRFRAALEGGKPDVVEEAMDSAENVGILNFLLKMAVVQAGAEVVTKETDHNSWMTDSGVSMGPLLMASAEANKSQKALAQVKAQLGMSRVDATEKTKKVLMNLVEGNNNALMSTVLINWDDAVKRIRRENEIEKEYEAEIAAANKRLLDYKERQLVGVRNVLLKGIAGETDALLKVVMEAFQREVQDSKNEKEKAVLKADLEERLKHFSEHTASNAKKVLTRMNAGNDQALINMVFYGFVQFHEEYKQNKEIEEAVKQKEKILADYMDKRTSSQKGVIQRMVGTTDSGLLTQCFKAWTTHAAEEAEAEKMQTMLDAKLGRLKGFSERRKEDAMSGALRLAMVMEGGTVLLAFTAWKKDAKIDRMRRYGKEKNAKRKQQLAGVKGLFKNFASELESGLKEGTPRVEPAPRP